LPTTPPQALAELESEGLLIFPDRPFVLDDAERGLLSAELSVGDIKNISFNPSTGRVGGAAANPADRAKLAGLLGRYAAWARGLIEEVAPSYGAHLIVGRTSFRPRPVEAGGASPRKDDRRLHADAFPSSPVGGRRILRVFSNINPSGEAREWGVGEPFEAYARRWLPQVRRNAPGEAWLLRRLGITRALRTDYDAIMLGLHDAGKLDADYQASAPRREIAFAPGASWIAFTDSVIHAAVKGRMLLEQTFYLPVEAMADQSLAPLRILERLTGRRLAP
jgi:hypothetical protein